jgi:hypothetical protein
MKWYDRNHLILFISFVPILLCSQEHKIGDVSDGSRTTPVHLIKLIDQDSSVIWLDESPLMPFSTKYTCGACHNYDKIGTGWHFSAGDSSAGSGRPGQPWIYADPYSATQIPLSLRDWPGTYKPEQLGLNNFSYLATFGRHMPGGGIGDKEKFQSLDMYWRWQVSGEFEINCLSCHDAERAHDQSLHALQILRENFRWAATASSGFASVQGTAKGLPDTYDIYSGAVPGHAEKSPPKVAYQPKRFNKKGEIFFDITRHIPDERCYFCHSTKTIEPGKSERWEFDEDVHLKAGLGCVDCHRHGLDHKMARGYEVQKSPPLSNTVNSLTCRGCHLGINEDTNAPESGRLGAPKPEHSGIPLIHFEKLSCTTCHSGSWPKDETASIKTSMAHALGLPKANKSDQALPHIISPVFAEGIDGKIAPHNLLWPSYWAEMQGDEIVPLIRGVFLPIAQKVIGYIDSLATGNWPQLADSHMVKVLDSLKVSGLVSNRPVYVGGGKIHFLDDNNKLLQKDHKATAPYIWPLAHDVRPAMQSLGVRGCDDCHSTDSNFYFGKVPIRTPLQMIRVEEQTMNEYLNQNMVAAWIFSFSFLFRPWLKYLIIFSSFLTMAILFLYGFRGLAKVISVVSSENHLNDEER